MCAIKPRFVQMEIEMQLRLAQNKGCEGYQWGTLTNLTTLWVRRREQLCKTKGCP